MSAESIIFTSAFGARRFGEMALGLGRSLKLIGDATRRVVLTDIDGLPFEKSFHEVIRASVPKEEIWWSKFLALQHTDARKVIFLDADMLAFKRLDDVYAFFQGAPLGVQGIWRNSGSWYDAPLEPVCRAEGVEAIPKFNAGLLYYERGPELDTLLAEGRDAAERYVGHGFRLCRGFPSEEVCLSLAMARTGLGKVADESENFHNSAVGLVGKLHLSVMRNECRYLCRRYDLQYVEPYVFHAHLYNKFLIYWKQLRDLERLEEYESRHGFGYMPPGHKLRRSIERRLLKLMGKL